MQFIQPRDSPTHMKHAGQQSVFRLTIILPKLTQIDVQRNPANPLTEAGLTPKSFHLMLT